MNTISHGNSPHSGMTLPELVGPGSQRQQPSLAGISDPDKLISVILNFARNRPCLYPQLCMNHEDPLLCAFGALAAKRLEDLVRSLPFEANNTQVLLNLKSRVLTEVTNRVYRELEGICVSGSGRVGSYPAAIERRVKESLELQLVQMIRQPALDGQAERSRPAAPVRKRKVESAYAAIDGQLRAIAASRPESHCHVFEALDGRIAFPSAEPFLAAKGWLRGYRRDPARARSWLSQRWCRLGLPPFPRGRKKRENVAITIREQKGR
jgi:hypothetical protein